MIQFDDREVAAQALRAARAEEATMPGAARNRVPTMAARIRAGHQSTSGGPVIPLSVAQLAEITGAALDQVPDAGGHRVPGRS